MGLLIGRLCCSKCGRNERVTHSVTAKASMAPATELRRFKVLLLGLSGSGKTELGLYLSGQKRESNDHSPTNGVRFYRVQLADQSPSIELSLTEVGGNLEMQRIWSHYYATTWAIIFCYDMSTDYTRLAEAFALLQRTLDHAALRGKAVLLVATHAQANNCEAIQLYDIENTFNLEAMACRYGSSLRLCYFDGQPQQPDAGDIWHGIEWLQRQLSLHQDALSMRIKYDVNMQTWQRQNNLLLTTGKTTRGRYRRFKRHRKLWPASTSTSGTELGNERPNTAPSSIFSITASTIHSSTRGLDT